MTGPEWWSLVSPASAGPAASGTRYTIPASGAKRPLDPYAQLAKDTASRHGLSPSLLAGVWDFESSGNPGAINKSSGATGLGQVMPRERGFPDRPTQAELLNPETNAEWSARILKSGLQRYGSEDKALAAYLGAIDARGNITGAVDANGTGGNRYIQTVRERQQRYADLAAGSGAPAAPAAPPSTAAPAPGGTPSWWSLVSAQKGRVSGGAPPRGGGATGWLGVAEQQLGKPYVWGSKGGRSDFSSDAAGFDCSGFVAYVYKNALGVDVPAFTGTAYPTTRAVGRDAAQPGDLVFYNMNTSDPRRQHVAIYAGDGKVIQSGGAGAGVNVASVDQMPGAEFRRNPTAYARYAGAPEAPAGGVATTAPETPERLTLQGASVPTGQAPSSPSWWSLVE